jgi:hypothetical protein
VDYHPHTVHLVAELLDDNHSLVRDDAGRRALLVDVLDERARRRFVA